jgi:hypothetical protein
VTPDSVVLVGLSIDEHLKAVAHGLERRGARVTTVPIDRPGSVPSVIAGRDSACRSVFVRSLEPLGTLAVHPTEEILLPEVLLGPGGEFMARERRAALRTWIDHLDPAVWVNEPEAMRAAEDRIRPIRTARACGLRVPETLITSDPADAVEFVEAHPAGAIRKTLSGPIVWADREDAGFLYASPAAVSREASGALEPPVLLQRRVIGEHEWRVFVIGETVHSVRISVPDGTVDWRRAIPRRLVRYRAEMLDVEVADRVRSVVRAMGLVYAAVDLVEDGDGPVFLEVNADGAYRWLETGLGLGITETICDRLLA